MTTTDTRRDVVMDRGTYLGDGITLTGEQVHYGTRCAHRHATDPGEAAMFLNMLGLADDYERSGPSKARNTDVVARYLAGEPVKDIAADLGVTAGTIYYRLRAAGHEPDRNGRREHGTPAGYRQHQRAAETACEPCADAWRTYNREWQRARRAS